MDPAADTTAPPQPANPAGVPRLLTIAEAASATGASKKALSRRIDRGTLRAVHDDQGRRVVPRAELVRAGLLNEDGSPGSPGGAITVWRDLYERERDSREAADSRVRDLELELVAIANAGPFRALRLRKRLRDSLPTRTPSPSPAAVAVDVVAKQ